VMKRMDGVESRNISRNRSGQTAKDIAQRAEADRQLVTERRQRGGAEVRRGPVMLTRAELRNLDGYKSSYYRAMR